MTFILEVLIIEEKLLREQLTKEDLRKADLKMAVMDEFKDEREALKNGTPKEKLSYFWCYYKWYVIGPLIAIILIASFAYEVLTRKEIVFNIAMLNVSELSQMTTEVQTKLPQSFADYAGIDTNAYDIFFDTTYRISEDGLDDTSMSSSEKLYTYVAAGQLDAMLTDSDSFRKYANADNFYDLREILSEEQIEKYEPYFYYVDWAVVEAIDIAADNLEDTTTITTPDPTKPEEMEEPIPVGIYINNEQLQEEYYFRGEDIVIGVYQNTKHLDYSLRFIDFLSDGTTSTQ